MTETPVQEAIERRTAPRLARDAVPGIGSVTLHPREPAELLNISSTGLLVSCTLRLLPNSTARFVLRGFDEEVVVTGRVVRSQVLSVGGDEGVTYETAIRSDCTLDLERYRIARPETSWNDRRIHTRVSGPFEGRWLTGTGEVAVTLSDLSEGGCFVEHTGGMHPGKRLSLRIRVPHHDQVLVAGEVLSTNPELGWAVRFINLEDNQRLILRRVVESLQPASVNPAPASEPSAKPGTESLPEVGRESPSETHTEPFFNDW